MRLLLSILLILFSLGQVSATYVNSAATDDYGGTYCDPCAGPSLSTSTGNLLVVAVRWYYAENSRDISGLTDTAGNTYTLIYRTLYGGNGLALYYAKNITGNAENVPSADFAGNIRYWSITQAEYSGLDTTSPLDQNTFGESATPTSVTSNSFTTTTANQDIVVIAQVGQVGANWTPSTNYTLRAIGTSKVLALQDRTVTSIQSGITLTMTNDASSGTASMVVATFKAAGGATAARRRVIN